MIYRAYAQVLLDLYGADAAGQYEVRARRFMALYLDRDPKGSFVAQAGDGSLAGAVFCFVWGQVGWFGSLGVAPEWQGRGIAQALTSTAVNYLTERGCTRIGLETWPKSALVEHLYGKFGFQTYRSTVKLSRTVTATPLPTGWNFRWYGHHDATDLASAIESLDAIATAQNVTSSGDPPPEYAAELRAPIEGGWAEALVVSEPSGTPAGVALCYVRKPGGGPVTALDTRLLLIAPGEGDETALDTTLAALDGRAAVLGLSGVTCDVNLRYSRAARLLRQRGFHPIYELVRMERPTPGFDPASRSPLIECARWAG